MSYWRNYYHLVWCTDERLPLITPKFESHLYNYLIRKAAELEAKVIEINGIEDHIHLVMSIPPKVSVSDVVKLLKGASAHYINHDIRPGDTFGWQRGYGCLTIGEKQLSIASEYVRNQKTHHHQGMIVTKLEHSLDVDDGPEIFQEIRKIGESPAEYFTDIPF